jgi:hypothetical protein
MDENTNKALFTLMQKVVDKLDVITEKINTKNETVLSDIILKKNSETKELISKTINNQAVLNQTNLDIENRIINSIIENKATPTISNHREYSLLGSKSYFKPITLIIMLFSLITIWSSLKYLPSYFIENGSLSDEKEEYELFYNYVYLKQFKNDEPNIAGEILKKVKQKNTLFMKEYHTLLSTYKREIKRQKLKEELNSLDNNDN